MDWFKATQALFPSDNLFCEKQQQRCVSSARNSKQNETDNETIDDVTGEDLLRENDGRSQSLLRPEMNFWRTGETKFFCYSIFRRNFAMEAPTW